MVLIVAEIHVLTALVVESSIVYDTNIMHPFEVNRRFGGICRFVFRVED
jgi:hypothetical protein